MANEETRPVVPTGIRGIYGGIPTAWFDRNETLADYGVNAVWIGSDSLTVEGIALLKSQGANVFAEFNTMHHARYLEAHADAEPVGTDGEVCPPPDGWQGVCPTHAGYRAERMAAFRDTLRRFDIDGIWLDYHHSHASWEQAEPNLPDTCFCSRCLELFKAQTGCSTTGGSARAISSRLLGEQRDAWVAWRCGVFTDWVREFREIADAERPGALLGTFHCPWSDAEAGASSAGRPLARSGSDTPFHRSWRDELCDGALREKLAIDLKAQAPYLDIFSTMPYHARFGHASDPAWISRQVAWLGRHLGLSGAHNEVKRIWPIVQIADWGETVPVEQIEAVLEHGSRAPATGVISFAWHGLHADAEKQQAIGRFYRGRDRQ